MAKPEAKKAEKKAEEKKANSIYKLKALNVVIGGKLFLKEDKPVFDISKEFKNLKGDILAAEKAGFLELSK